MTSETRWLTLGLLLAALAMGRQLTDFSLGRAVAQTGPLLGPPTDPRPAAGPSQPVPLSPPTAQQQPAPTPQPAPVQLSPQQQANLDWVLSAWQQRSTNVKTFECSFTRWEYDPVFGDPTKPSFVDEGRIAYRAPDKGLFRVDEPKEREERWICDGTSIYQYDFANKCLIQHKLPPELQGKAIVESPLPFIFGADTARLKQRYFLRIVTPPNVQGQETWLEAYPRFQQDAANFSRAELILTSKNMTPYALQIHAPNGQNRTVYQFRNIVVNDPLAVLKNPFHPLTPPFWKKRVEEALPPQAGRQAGPAMR
jgi:TIGR03009 family protein